jgi:hypothetical protein
VLAEVNTHTLFSRNSGSSRAIPLRSKNLKGTLDRLEAVGPAFPERWPLEQPGMQGADEEIEVLAGRLVWHDAMWDAIGHAEKLLELGLHKSVTNRLLEPFMLHTATITAVDFEGFFRQRSWHHTKLVQPEFGKVATLMEDLYRASTPESISSRDWHTPYIRPEERQEFPLEVRLAISAGRTARTSYLTHDGERDPDADVALYERLVEAEPPHASPLQHVMTPAEWNETTVLINPEDYGLEGTPKSMTVPIVGNCRGWMQLRHIVLGF